MEKLSVTEVLVEFSCMDVCILQIYLKEALVTGVYDKRKGKNGGRHWSLGL